MSPICVTPVTGRNHGYQFGGGSEGGGDYVRSCVANNTFNDNLTNYLLCKRLKMLTIKVISQVTNAYATVMLEGQVSNSGLPSSYILA
ncbi:hypothetical protein QTP88_017950 [Uroleucon formosanum]